MHFKRHKRQHSKPEQMVIHAHHPQEGLRASKQNRKAPITIWCSTGPGHVLKQVTHIRLNHVLPHDIPFPGAP